MFRILPEIKNWYAVFSADYTMHQKDAAKFFLYFCIKKSRWLTFLLSARQRTFHSQNAVSCLLIPGQARWVSADRIRCLPFTKTA